MPCISIASFNIEKNGQSSHIDKQTKVSEFVDICVKRGADIIFLCEVHSGRVGDYVDFARNVYGATYDVDSLAGGHSNAYVLLTIRDRFLLSFDGLEGLNRNFALCHIEDSVGIGLAHFKSGQTGLTKNQLQKAAAGMQDVTKGRWAITGDMNWDMHNAQQLNLPAGTKWASCWKDMTHKGGGILDWCAAGSAVILSAADGPTTFDRAFQLMDGPDHRPVVFQIGYS